MIHHYLQSRHVDAKTNVSVKRIDEQIQMNDTTVISCIDLVQMNVCEDIDECDIKHGDILSSVLSSMLLTCSEPVYTTQCTPVS